MAPLQVYCQAGVPRQRCLVFLLEMSPLAENRRARHVPGIAHVLDLSDGFCSISGRPSTWRHSTELLKHQNEEKREKKKQPGWLGPPQARLGLCQEMLRIQTGAFQPEVAFIFYFRVIQLVPGSLKDEGHPRGSARSCSLASPRVVNPSWLPARFLCQHVPRSCCQHGSGGGTHPVPLP